MPRGRCRGVHHRAHIVHARFETGQVVRVDTVGKTRAALVEQDQPRERRKPLQEPAVAFVFPVQVEIGNEARHEDEIERSLAYHLVGDPHVAARAYRVSGSATVSPRRKANATNDGA